MKNVRQRNRILVEAINVPTETHPAEGVTF